MAMQTMNDILNKNRARTYSISAESTMVNKKAVIIVLFIMFPVARMAKQPLKPEGNEQTSPRMRHVLSVPDLSRAA